MTPREQRLEALLLECYDLEDQIADLTLELERVNKEKSRIGDMSEQEYKNYCAADKSE